MTLKRTSIMLDDKLLMALRTAQAKKIVAKNKNVSMSEIINQILAETLKVKI